MRKLAEKQTICPSYKKSETQVIKTYFDEGSKLSSYYDAISLLQEFLRCLISPRYGPVFMNAPLEFYKLLPKSLPGRIGPEDDFEDDVPTEPDEPLVFHTSDVIKEMLLLSKVSLVLKFI